VLLLKVTYTIHYFMLYVLYGVPGHMYGLLPQFVTASV